MLWGPILSLFGSQKLGLCPTKAYQKVLVYLGELLEAGKLIPVIDRRFPLSAVADAIRYVEEGHARGKVIINVDPSTIAS
jgi:NADPH:quinone reductase-like Zn-dependent oxidoreductase